MQKYTKTKTLICFIWRHFDWNELKHM